MSNKKKILVLGNDPQINQIDFKRLDPSVKTLGVNRIFLAHIPHYYFFHDPEILQELRSQPEILALLNEKSISFTSDWFTRTKMPIPEWLKVYKRQHIHRYSFPDSVTTAIRLISDNLIDRSNCTFYIAGVSLTWSQPSHFWKEINYPSLNKHDQTWYNPRFSKILDNFKNLKNTKYDLVSVNPGSSLNRIMRSESIDNLYIK